MKLYPTATEQYITKSGRLTTDASKKAARMTLGPLQRCFPDHHVGDFTSRQLTEFCLSGTPAPNTIRARRNRIKSAWEWFQFAGVVKSNPATDLKFTLSPSSNNVRDGVWLVSEQRRQLLAVTEDTLVGRRDRLVVLFGMLCGLRVIEMTRLRWDDFSPDMSTFKLLGKGNKRATVGVPPMLRQELLEWRQTAPEDAVAVLPSFRLVFTPEDAVGVQERELLVQWDHPLGHSGIENVMQKLSGRVPFRFRAHDLRRTYAGILEEKGLPLKQIQELMRHSSINTTDRYLSRNPHKAVELGQTLEIDL